MLGQFLMQLFLNTFVWPKAIQHRSLGQRPRTDVGESMVLANGHIHFKCDAEGEQLDSWAGTDRRLVGPRLR
jgi:hypothetical protein